MNTNRSIYYYKANLPSYLLPIVLFFGLVVFSALAVLGLLIGIVIGTLAIGLILIRFLVSSKKKETMRVEEDGRTIVLREDEYEVVEKKS